MSAKQIASSERRLLEVINLVPVEQWGFADEVRHRLSEHRRALAKQHSGKSLSDRRKLSSGEKRQIVRALPENCTTVGDVLALMARQPTVAPPVLPTESKNTRPVVGKGKRKATTESPRPSTVSKKLKADLTVVRTPNRVEALTRLHERIADLKHGRTKNGQTDDAEVKKNKRRISKIKHKERVKGTTTGKGNTEKTVDTPATKSKSSQPSSTSPKMEADVVYSKFDFVQSQQSKAVLQDSSATDGKMKRKSPKLHGHDYKTLLSKVEARQRKIAAAESSNPEKAKRLKENIKLSDAMQRAEGNIVKNDATKLRQSMKNKARTKERSERKWKGREEQVRKDRTGKQQSRKDNIKKRVEEKKNKKMGKKSKPSKPKGRPKPQKKR